ncbi:MAG: hypothetical protein PUE72_05420 [Lachnospiraceae bacterium]|nr:hypothetical protein [Lachnospiraceae bacterium]
MGWEKFNNVFYNTSRILTGNVSLQAAEPGKVDSEQLMRQTKSRA